VADHARDERRHHAFYSRCFRYLWGLLEPRLREQAARSLPDMVLACLSTDVGSVRVALRAAGLEPGEIEQVIAETYTRQAELASIRRSARHTLRMFANHDVLCLPGAGEAFQQAGLLTGDGDVILASSQRTSRS
jgi:hypothetical protein